MSSTIPIWILQGKSRHIRWSNCVGDSDQHSAAAAINDPNISTQEIVEICVDQTSSIHIHFDNRRFSVPNCVLGDAHSGLHLVFSAISLKTMLGGIGCRGEVMIFIVISLSLFGSSLLRYLMLFWSYFTKAQISPQELFDVLTYLVSDFVPIFAI